MVSRGPGYVWSCPGDRLRNGLDGPWCAGLPCPGHRATKAQVLAAKILAWADGLEWDHPDCAQRAYLTTARRVLVELGHPIEAPR